MQRFDATKLNAAVAAFGSVAGLFAVCPRKQYDLSRGTLAAKFNDLLAALRSAPEVSRGLASQFDRVRDSIQTATWENREPVTDRCIEFIHNLLHELGEDVFLYIKPDRRAFYEQLEPPFGEAVASAFPEVEYDIQHASRCIAFDEWTAAVFHLMRAVELALRALAKRLNIKGVDIKEGAGLLQDIDSALHAMRQKKRTAKRDRDLEFYSKARTSIAGFNDAWRKHVMHSRGKYNEQEAMVVYQHVKALMQQLAQGS